MIPKTCPIIRKRHDEKAEWMKHKRRIRAEFDADPFFVQRCLDAFRSQFPRSSEMDTFFSMVGSA